MTDTTSRCASCAAGDHDPAEPFLEPCTCCANDHYPAALEGPRCGDHAPWPSDPTKCCVRNAGHPRPDRHHGHRTRHGTEWSWSLDQRLTGGAR